MEIRSGAGLVRVLSIPRAECLELLRTAGTGRVVLTHRNVPGSLPVRYTVDADDIVFRIDLTTPAVSMIDGSVVALQVDSIDLSAHAGWSVVIVGRAEAMLEQDTALVRLPTRQMMGHRLAQQQAD